MGLGWQNTHLFLIGQAQEDGYLTINDTSSKYLGLGWTNCTSSQENLITIKNQLTMTSGLDDGVADPHCTIDTCLNYLAPVNTRWAYHNAPYTLLEQVIENATSMNMNNYTQLRLKTPTGITGLWVMNGFNNVFYSKVRSMARFGLLIQNNGIWNQDTLLHDNVYKSQMINTSQNLNNSYGYLWWLNGKSSFMVPTSQITFPGSYAPDAPNDMFAGIGKNGQIVSISPSKGLVMVRMGESPSSTGQEVPFLLCTNIWKRLNEAMCSPNSIIETKENEPSISISPNPSTKYLKIGLPSSKNFSIRIMNIIGKTVMVTNNESSIDISSLTNGIYLAKIEQGGKTSIHKFIKQ